MAFLASPANSFDTRAARSSATRNRSVLVLVLALALAGAIVAGNTGSADAIREAGGDLTYLLRMMALLKAGMAAVVVGIVFWRLGAPVDAPRLAGYAAACAAMAAGPALIWSMAHVGLGALLLHAGLLAGVLLMWRDPTVGAQLSATIIERRQRRR